MLDIRDNLRPQSRGNHARVLERYRVDFESIREAYMTDFNREDTGPQSIFLDPEIMSEAVLHYHELRGGLSWSWGGYLDCRSNLWRGSYLDSLGPVLHAGIDVNLPVNTPVRANGVGRVLRVDQDDEEGGWGPRVFLHPQNDYDNAVIYAHLKNVRVREGDEVGPGTLLGQIGSAPQNGNWWPHLHIQRVAMDIFLQCRRASDFSTIDGYFPAAERSLYIRRYPDPIEYVSAHWEPPTTRPV